MILWSVHSCFHWCKKYKNRPRSARVIVENKAVPFLWDTVYIVTLYIARTYIHKRGLKLDCTVPRTLNKICNQIAVKASDSDADSYIPRTFTQLCLSGSNVYTLHPNVPSIPSPLTRYHKQSTPNCNCHIRINSNVQISTR